ncbi:hypothetical protein [Paraflavitalea sp. CAU 1676]|uniref:LA_2272 family surface repeat-containing protein n=1 Tax=Paraflavitalea sp. CAU 1676 TaxID=3032598 RepID=UPI0023DB3653|nr:hypothetical protein [Paraflavitalea sp. CAU 1676]MDF2190152.1 hypothetical protein [Paraflavitalea sp. CAU 1676]
MNRLFVFTLILLTAFAPSGYARQDSVQNLYFVKDGDDARFGEHDYQPGKGAFYLYRHCIYDLVLMNKKAISIMVTDIRQDSIYYILAFRRQAKPYDGPAPDTFSLHPSQLKRLKLIGDRMMGLYENRSFSNYRYVFVKSDEPKAFTITYTTSYSADSSYSEDFAMVPYLTAQGINWLYEQRGKTYYYEGIAPTIEKDSLGKDSLEALKPGKERNWAWYTPSGAGKINGLSLGLQTTIDEKPITINGLNLNADALSAFVAMFGLFHILTNLEPINMPDTVDKKNMNKFLNGVSISAGGLMGEMRVRGFSINGGMSGVTEMSGLHITGTQNRTDEFKGVVITGITNRAVKGRGLQIGLVNSCKHLRGVQLGLWNINGKRSLPLFNWQFRG